jgi:hypothetical protein
MSYLTTARRVLSERQQGALDTAMPASGATLAVEAVRVGPTSDVTAVWQAVLDRLRGDPLFPPDLLNAMRGASVRWGSEPAQNMAEANELGNAAKPVCRCGSTRWRDVRIHGGQSVRRDCRKCRKFIAFPVWYGRATRQKG